MTLQLAPTGPVAFRLFVADALDTEAERFYQYFGLAPLGDDCPCRMVLDLRPLFAGRSPPRPERPA